MSTDIEKSKEQIGVRIREVRKQKKLTQEELEDMTAIKRSSISEYENAKKSIYCDTLLILADALEVSAAYLLTGENDSRLWTYEKFNELLNDLSEEDCKCVYAIVQAYVQNVPRNKK